MRHSYGRNLLDDVFDVMAVDAVWQKGVVIPGTNPNLIRKDSQGFWIERYNYGDTTRGGTGWEIDHIISVDDGGGDHLDNLQPMQWQNNRSGADHSDANRGCDFISAGNARMVYEDYRVLEEPVFK